MITILEGLITILEGLKALFLVPLAIAGELTTGAWDIAKGLWRCDMTHEEQAALLLPRRLFDDDELLEITTRLVANELRAAATQARAEAITECLEIANSYRQCGATSTRSIIDRLAALRDKAKEQA